MGIIIKGKEHRSILAVFVSRVRNRLHKTKKNGLLIDANQPHGAPN